MGFYRGPNIVTDGLVFAYDAGSERCYPGSGTTANSLTSSNTGTLTNGVGFSSSNGGSWEFDGVDDYINIPTSSNLDGFSNASFETWVEPDNTSSYRRIFDKDGVTCYNISLNPSSNPYIYVDGSYAQSTLLANVDQWNHIIITYDGTNARFYKNGAIVDTVSLNQGQIPSNSNDLRIGSNYDSNTSMMNGHIAIAKIYNQVLTAAEVAQNFNAQKSRFGL